jgi:hypothetical protein
MSDTMAQQLRFLLDREAIRDVVTRYCRGVDRMDEAVLASVYWPEATHDHGLFTGKASDFIPVVLNMAGITDQMHHLIGNILIRNSGDTARCETYFHAYQRMRGEKGPYDYIVAGRYLDELERRGGEWRIIRRKAVFDWFREYPDSADWSQGLHGTPVPMGGRLPEDASVALFAQDRLDLPAGS